MTDTLRGACPIPTDPSAWPLRLAALRAAGTTIPDRDALPTPACERPAPAPFVGQYQPRPETGQWTEEGRAASIAAQRRREQARRGGAASAKGAAGRRGKGTAA